MVDCYSFVGFKNFGLKLIRTSKITSTIQEVHLLKGKESKVETRHRMFTHGLAVYPF